MNEKRTRLIDALKNKNLEDSPYKFIQPLIIFLVLTDIILLTIISFVHIPPEEYALFVVFDLIVVLILIPEFLYRLWKSDDKKQFIMYNFTDIIGMIPEIILGRFGIYARYFRLIRIASLFKKDIKGLLEFLQKTHIDYGIFLIAVILFSGAIIFYMFENGTNPQVNSLDDAIWYLVVTITTVGYGDIYAQTTAGRVVGAIIMFVGIGFISFLTATITSLFLKDKEDEEIDKIDILNTKIDDLQSEISELKDLIRKSK